MPPVICETTPSFQATAAGKSRAGSPPTTTPSRANVSRASCSACAVCTQAFVGMQPTRRQVPPSAGSLSMQTTLPPSWAARIAAVYPAGPPPRTATSHSMRSIPFHAGPNDATAACISRVSPRPGTPRGRAGGSRIRPRPATSATRAPCVLVRPAARACGGRATCPNPVRPPSPALPRRARAVDASLTAFLHTRRIDAASSSFQSWRI